ncbi:MAG: metal-dependent hydrolase [Flavobacteriales bacterium]|nr:metal-dependent hydrolase [Flavobacteriales bacterium]
MKVTFLGHATIYVEINGKKILFDPFVSPNELAKDIDVDAIEADYIFVSHGHEDHVADVERIAKRTGATIVSNFEIAMWFNAKGCTNYHPMNHGGKWKFDFGTVKYVNAVHSSTLPDGKSGGNPGGFVFETSQGNFYYAGDTALTMDMKLIPLSTKLDFAILPIGDNFTMGVDDAIQAAQFVQVEKVLAMHFDTFGFIRVDHKQAIAKFREADIQLTLLGIGESAEM